MCVCVHIYYLIHAFKHSAPQYSDKFTCVIHTFYLLEWKEYLFIMIWLFTMAYTVISEMDGCCRCCGESPSMTLHTPPVHTELEPALPALCCSTVIHWHGLPPEGLYICNWNALLVHIIVKANIIVSCCTVHLKAVFHSPHTTLVYENVRGKMSDRVWFPCLFFSLIWGN